MELEGQRTIKAIDIGKTRLVQSFPSTKNISQIKLNFIATFRKIIKKNCKNKNEWKPKEEKRKRTEKLWLELASNGRH